MRTALPTLALLGATIAAGACSGSGEKTVLLNGAGATFPNIIYQKWITDYNASHPGVQLNYQSIGSGGGIAQFTGGTVDFGASDAPMNDSEMTKATPTARGRCRTTSTSAASARR